MDTNRNHFVQRTLKAGKLQGCSLNGTQEYIPAVHYDAAVNAFHYQAVEYILPYPLNFDNTSWWISQWYIIIKSKVIFRGQIVLHTGLIAKYRAYPRKKASIRELQDIVKLVQDDLPIKKVSECKFVVGMEGIQRTTREKISSHLFISITT